MFLVLRNHISILTWKLGLVKLFYFRFTGIQIAL